VVLAVLSGTTQASLGIDLGLVLAEGVAALGLEFLDALPVHGDLIAVLAALHIHDPQEHPEQAQE
jgi:hypothetical protein